MKKIFLLALVFSLFPTVSAILIEETINVPLSVTSAPYVKACTDASADAVSTGPIENIFNLADLGIPSKDAIIKGQFHVIAGQLVQCGLNGNWIVNDFSCAPPDHGAWTSWDKEVSKDFFQETNSLTCTANSHRDCKGDTCKYKFRANIKDLTLSITYQYDSNIKECKDKGGVWQDGGGCCIADPSTLDPTKFDSGLKFSDGQATGPSGEYLCDTHSAATPAWVLCDASKQGFHTAWTGASATYDYLCDGSSWWMASEHPNEILNVAGIDWTSDGAHWYSCGGAPSDCGLLYNNKICDYKDSSVGPSQWLPATPATVQGNVRYIGCLGFPLLFNSATWLACTSDDPMLPPEYKCVASLSGTTNAAVGACSRHPYKVYCKPPVGDLICDVKQNCGVGEINIMELDAPHNAKPSIPGSGKPFKLCCSASIGSLHTTPSADPTLSPLVNIIDLSSNTDALAAQADIDTTNYPVNIYLRHSDGAITCELKTFGDVGTGVTSYTGPKLGAGTENPYNIDGHDYLCSHNINSLTISECCGDSSGSCLSSGDSVKKITGDIIEQSTAHYYCTSDRKWITNIDNAGGNTCVTAGFTWTGSYCCEDYTPGEYYNDKTGGCWNQQAVMSNNYAPGSQSVVNYNGQFYGCKIADATLLNLQNTKNNTLLIQNMIDCDVKGNFVCVPTGQWVALNQPEAEVCAKYSFDGSARGFCPESSQCLVNIVSGQSQCINNSRFISDNYCDNGYWTSRTKLIALQLLSLTTTNDYTIFCDKPSNVLNYISYASTRNIMASDYIQGKANNFCILKQGSLMAIGTSLNKPITSSPAPFIDLLEISNCNDPSLVNDGQYHPCDSSNRVWYNNKTQSVIYSKSAINLGIVDLSTSFINLLKNPVTSFINLILGSLHNQPYDYSIVQDTRRFDKLFIDVYGPKKVVGILEAPFYGRQYLVVNYTGFTTSLCNALSQYDTRQDPFTQISCTSNSMVVSRDFVNENAVGEFFKVENIWNDLTSKLRIR